MGLQFTVEHVEDLTIPEDTILRAQLIELKIHEFEWTDYKSNSAGEKKTSQVLQWWWEITADGKYKGRKVKGETDVKISDHPRNRFRQWVETLLGREITAGMGLNEDDLIGLSADITVRHEKDKKDPAKFYERLDEVLPITGGFSVDDAPPF